MYLNTSLRLSLIVRIEGGYAVGRNCARPRPGGSRASRFVMALRVFVAGLRTTNPQENTQEKEGEYG
jgi:hypothetical protein